MASTTYTSAYRYAYKALRDRLTRTGVVVGTTAGYPRVELHSFTEAERLDKGDSVRVISCVMESISNKSIDEAGAMNEDNLELLQGYTDTGAGFGIFGVVPRTLTDLTGSDDSQKIIYRQIQNLDIFISKQS